MKLAVCQLLATVAAVLHDSDVAREAQKIIEER
jgi:hypothetical protein